MGVCKQCPQIGAMTDILMNVDCPNCDVCECLYCDKNMLSEDFDLCPLGNACEDCGHLHAICDCAYSDRVIITRK